MRSVLKFVFGIAAISVFVADHRATIGDERLPNDRRAIEELVSQLVSTNKDPNPDLKPDIGFPVGYDKEAQQTVNVSRQKLKELGKDAFPILIENMDDTRYSMSISTAVLRSLTVGDVCLLIIEGQVDLAGMRYKSRVGADGHQHTCLSFVDQYMDANSNEEPDDVPAKKKGDNSKKQNSRPQSLKSRFAVLHQNGLRKWWRQHRDHSLKEIQIEALNWTIDREQEIGFQDEDDKKEFLVPLIEMRDELMK